MGEGIILWQHWVDAYEWDIANHCIKIYKNLCQDHFTLDGPEKMKNNLAFDVLNKDMLHLMKVSRTHLIQITSMHIKTCIQGILSTELNLSTKDNDHCV